MTITITKLQHEIENRDKRIAALEAALRSIRKHLSDLMNYENSVNATRSNYYNSLSAQTALADTSVQADQQKLAAPIATYSAAAHILAVLEEINEKLTSRETVEDNVDGAVSID